jgi:hypothetical protein
VFFLKGYSWEEARREAGKVYDEADDSMKPPFGTVLLPGVEATLKQMKAHGLKLAIASTDTHMGRAAYKGEDLSVEFMRPKFGGNPVSGGGLAAIYAEELTREKLWDSLLKRRTFGTTGEKIVVDFSMGKAFMGEGISADSPQTIRAKVIGTSRIKKVEIIKIATSIKINKSRMC